LIAHCDAACRYLFVNRAYAARLGRTESEIIGEHVSEVLGPLTFAILKPRIDQALSGRPAEFEEEVDFPHLGRARMYARYIPDRDATGNVCGFSAVITHIADRDRSELALRESEARFRLMADAAPVLIWVSDAQKKGIFFNKGWLSFTGRSLEQELGDGWLEVIHPEDVEGAAAACLRAFEACEPFQMEFRMRRADGHYRWMLDHGVPRFTETGALAGYIGSCIDFTDRHEAEKGLLENQQRLRLALDAGQMGAWEWSMETNRVIWSPGLEAIHGLQPGTFPGTYEAYWSDVHPEDRYKVEESIRHTLESGEDHHIEYRITCPDDSVHFVEARGKLFRDETGNPLRMIGVCADVTARKRAEQALRESEERFRTLADSSPVLIWVNGLEGCEFVNRAYLDYLQIQPAEVKESNWQRFIHPDDRDGYVNAYRDAFANRETFIAQCRFRRFDGEYRWVKSVGLPRFSGSGEFLGYVGCTLDITDIKEAEERLREDDRRKDDFLALLAHELRNPLAAICTGLEVMSLAADPAQLSQVRAMMERQSRQLVAMVDDLLEISRITRGKLELHKTRVTLADIVESAIETARPAIDQARHELSVEVPDEKLEMEGDPNRLSQILSNLLGNAAKFTPDGGHIRLTLEKHEDEALLAVRDSGIGIPAAMQDKIFDMFAQAGHPLDRSATGLGMGLTLAKALAEMHGGTIDVHSEGAGKGSEFRVRLPLAPIPADETPPDEVPVRAEVGPGVAGLARRRVLIVDDNLDAAQMLHMLVEGLGGDVRTAPDGAQAVTIASDFRPEIVLMDLGMPRMNGYDAAGYIRRQSWGKDMMLVALTGWGQEKDRQRIMQAGFDRHLVKPAKPEQLRELLAGSAERVSS
jgi:PAS domain S-box-containing protein